MANEVWTDPRTWVDGETPTGSQFNTQLRDNLKYLKQGPVIDGTVSVVGDVTASSSVLASFNVQANQDLIAGRNLDVQGQCALRGAVYLGDAITDTVLITGTVDGAPLRTYTETKVDVAISGGVLAINLAAGTYFRVTLNSNHAVQISNLPPAGRVVGISIIYTADGTPRTVSWPPAVVWPSGVAPTLTVTAGKRDWITLVTDDGGVTWFGCIVGQLY